MTTPSELQDLLDAPEDEHLEFKEAKNRFDFEELVKYCCALANEGGGKIILGVTDQRPRRVVGSLAFEDLERTRSGLTDRLHLRIDAENVTTSDGRIVLFKVPARPLGVPLQYRGAYWMRSGDNLVGMTPDHLQKILDEARPDFSAQLCPEAVLDDLSSEAIEWFRSKWQERSRRSDLAALSPAQLLEDAELSMDGALTYAALILLGSRRALGRHLAQAELIFEYRTREGVVEYQQREEFREGLFLYFDRLWSAIHQHNDIHHLHDGAVRRELRAFNEIVVREALLNAVAHRDYRLGGSVFVRQWPRHITIVSPGGFPQGVTLENILFRQAPRNRRIAEALARCGLVERAGQGADLMFSLTVREGKPPPDFHDTDDHQVSITLDGTIQDERLIPFFEAVAQGTRHTLSVEDLLLIDAVLHKKAVPDRVTGRIGPLLDLGVIERLGRERYGLSHRFYRHAGDRAAYTRSRGLDRNANKALLLKHIRDNAADGSPFDELARVVPSLRETEVKTLLRELKAAGDAHVRGRTRGARWHPGPDSPD